MYNLHLSAEQLEIRDTVRDFVAQEIKPAALNANRLDACDRRLLADVLDKASQMGLRTLALSEELGGAGADTSDLLHRDRGAGGGRRRRRRRAGARRRRSAACCSRAMTTEQRERFLPRFLEDDRYHLARAEHEPDADTALGVNYHRPAATDVDLQDHSRAWRRRLDHQRRQALRRQRADRQAVRGRGRDRRPWRGHAAGAARCARPHRARAQRRAALVSRRLRRSGVRGLPRAGRQSSARRRSVRSARRASRFAACRP